MWQTAPYKDSGGGGYGGMGGDSGRGFIHGIFTGGSCYGNQEVPIPFGGSASSWAQTAPGNAGGGGVEIDVTGSVNLRKKGKILANGGTKPYICQYPAGGGSGGSVKIVANNNVTIDGLISVNGGDGGDGTEKGNNTGGGGAGGRIAIFYGGTCNRDGNPADANVSAKGGVGGVVVNSPTYPWHNDMGLATDGENGTIYIKDSDVVSRRKASAPTPKNGERLVYAPVTDTNLTLKWYSGYNYNTAHTAIDACDVVYFGITHCPTTQVGRKILATRGQHSATTDVNVSPSDTTIYYWRVQTVGTGIDVNNGEWTFRAVGWHCGEPNWEGPNTVKLDYNEPWMPVPNNQHSSVNALRAGWPTWDVDGDCAVTDRDLWFFGKYWEENKGGIDYKFDDNNLYHYVVEWMTCRGRTNSGCCVSGCGGGSPKGWPLTPDWIPPGVSGAM